MHCETFTYNTIIVGTGAAGYNTAGRLFDMGARDIAVVTEGVNAGTSRNTGSDKQTYYKLTLEGGEGDSVLDMCRTLFNGGAMDGDTALCEAALSAKCFFHLCDLGVDFPQNRYGEYCGYKTDHDPKSRATSVGPYTSKKMVEALEADVTNKNIKIFDGYQVVSILTEDGEVRGLVCLRIKAAPGEPRFTVFRAKNIVYAVGGPAGMYKRSAYPHGHYGASGIAFEAGVAGKNLTHWQFGLASISPRWNVSGTYMQVLPRFISTDKDGGDEQEFLKPYFKSDGDMLSRIFQKGYQWPFDVTKIGGSSYIDMLVYIEEKKGRRVFLDFRSGNVDFIALSPEAYDYLKKADAFQATPIERLMHMNMPAYTLYLDKGVDLLREPLEIALCPQHNNGGLDIDLWWQSNIKGFFPVGEVAGTHGAFRPGGSALNSGQVGSLRAATYIAHKRTGAPEASDTFGSIADAALARLDAIADGCLKTDGRFNTGSAANIDDITAYFTSKMNIVGGPVKNKADIDAFIAEIRETLDHFTERVSVDSPSGLKKLFRLRDILLSQYVYLSAASDYCDRGKSTGSTLYCTETGAQPAGLPEAFRHELNTEPLFIQEVRYKNGTCDITTRKPRGIPVNENFFENVWRDHREGRIYDDV